MNIGWTPPSSYLATSFSALALKLEAALLDLAVAKVAVVATTADLPDAARNINRLYRITASKALASSDGSAWYYADGTAV